MTTDDDMAAAIGVSVKTLRNAREWLGDSGIAYFEHLVAENPSSDRLRRAAAAAVTEGANLHVHGVERPGPVRRWWRKLARR